MGGDGPYMEGRVYEALTHGGASHRLECGRKFLGSYDEELAQYTTATMTSKVYVRTTRLSIFGLALKQNILMKLLD